VVEIFVREHGLSIQRSRIAGPSRTAFYRVPRSAAERDALVIEALNRQLVKRPIWGFWKCYDRMHIEGCPWNHKRVHRVYCAMRLNLPRRRTRRVPTRDPLPLEAPNGLNEVWSLDFMHDALYDGRPFRTFNVLDDGNREALGIDVSTSIPSTRAIRFMKQLIEAHGKPAALPARQWERAHVARLRRVGGRTRHQAALHRARKAEPERVIERFNKTYRTEVLNAYLFASISECSRSRTAG
jgi:putative transposase